MASDHATVIAAAGAAGYAFYSAENFWGVVLMALTVVWALVTALPVMDSAWRIKVGFVAAVFFGSIVVLLPLALALAWRFRRRGQLAAAVMLSLAVGGAALLAHAAKLLVVRPRPDLYPALIATPADLSFPSAHTMQITAFAFAWVLAGGSRPGWAGVTAAALVVLVVALSRLYLQVHFPSDVAIGMIAGATWVVGLRLAVGARA